MNAALENKELLKAVGVYKEALSGRDKDIEKYRATIAKYTQQLQRRVKLGDVKQTLLEQLQQTQYMISETHKRWKNSPIANGLKRSSPVNNASNRA